MANIFWNHGSVQELKRLPDALASEIWGESLRTGMRRPSYRLALIGSMYVSLSLADLILGGQLGVIVGAGIGAALHWHCTYPDVHREIVSRVAAIDEKSPASVADASQESVIAFRQ